MQIFCCWGIFLRIFHKCLLWRKLYFLSSDTFNTNLAATPMARMPSANKIFPYVFQELLLVKQKSLNCSLKNFSWSKKRIENFSWSNKCTNCKAQVLVWNTHQKYLFDICSIASIGEYITKTAISTLKGMKYTKNSKDKYQCQSKLKFVLLFCLNWQELPKNFTGRLNLQSYQTSFMWDKFDTNYVRNYFFSFQHI